MKSKTKALKNEKNLMAVRKHFAKQKAKLIKLKSCKLKSRDELDSLLEEKNQLTDQISKCRAKLWLYLVSMVTFNSM